MSSTPAENPGTTRTTYVAEIQDPVTQETTVLQAATEEELDLLIDQLLDPTS